MFTWMQQQVALDLPILHDKCSVLFYSRVASTRWSDGEEWKKRQIAEISSIAMPLLLRFHARIAHSTRCFADSVLSAVEHTISTASWFEITSHTYNNTTWTTLISFIFCFNQNEHVQGKECVYIPHQWLAQQTGLCWLCSCVLLQALK